MSLNKKSVFIFIRAQISSFAATIVDFGTLIVCVEVFNLWYMIGVVLGSTFGALTNFALGRYWSFKATREAIPGQALRYFIVFVGSLALNSGGVYFFTEFLKRPYWVSKIFTSFVVGVVYNFLMQKKYVFRKTYGNHGTASKSKG